MKGHVAAKGMSERETGDAWHEEPLLPHDSAWLWVLAYNDKTCGKSKNKTNKQTNTEKYLN